jgi:methylated-DNA-protein-cysteine methyltransferase-like protein
MALQKLPAGEGMDEQDSFHSAYGKSWLNPEGYVTTYGDVARLAGSARGATGWRRPKRLPEGSTLPWHRVVNRHGAISLTGPDLQRQRQALLSEGVQVSGSGQIDLQKYRWCTDPSPKRGITLLHLRRWGWQRRLIGLRCDRHFGLLYWHQVQVDFGSTVVNRFLDRIGDKHQLTVDGDRCLSRIRALGCTSDGLYGNTKLNGACLPSVRTARWATTFDGASARKHQTASPLIPHPAATQLSV